MEILLTAKKLCLASRLQDFSLEAASGETIGLLGINGAGKSTALSLLAGGQALTSGKVTLHTAEAGIGWLPQHSVTYPEMTTRENLVFYARIRGLNKTHLKPAVSQMIKQFNLDDLHSRLAKQLSGGERRRLDLACTLVHSPKILLLDEPTAGLDPLQAEQLRHTIKNLAPKHAIIIASHILTDIEQLCSRALLMNAGQIIDTETLHPNQCDMQAIFSRPPSDTELSAISGVDKVIFRDDNKLVIRLTADAPSIMPEKLSCHGWGLQSWQLAPNNLLQHFRDLSSGEIA